jgi:hypothetical protein
MSLNADALPTASLDACDGDLDRADLAVCHRLAAQPNHI